MRNGKTGPTIDFIQMRVSPGTDLFYAEKQAVRLAVEHETDVRFDFNGKVFQVTVQKVWNQCNQTSFAVQS